MLIAHVILEILDEFIVVKQEEVSLFPSGYTFLDFGSAKQYVVETGVASAAKGGGIISGDSYVTMELGAGKYAMAISDGMGKEERAQEESVEILGWCNKILKTVIQERAALKTLITIYS